MPAVRLKFALCRLAPDAAAAYFNLALQNACRVHVAELTLAERNLALPAHWLARALFPAKPAFWHGGAFWGLALRCGARALMERPILCGAGVLALFGR